MDDLIFENPTRKLLYSYILEHPGSSFQMLMRVMDLPEGTLRYHLNYLERRKKVVNEKKNGQVHYFSALTTEEKNEQGIILNPEQERVLELITKEPGIKRKELMIRTRVQDNAMDHILRKLKENRLIWKKNFLNGPGYERVTKERIKEEVYLLIVDKLLKGEIDKEEFRGLREKLREL